MTHPGVELNQVSVTAREEPRCVTIRTAAFEWHLEFGAARKFARAILDQADIAELEAMRDQK